MILPIKSGYFKTFKVRDKDKKNKLRCFLLENEKPLEMYKTTETKIENLKHFELNALPVYDDRCVNTKIRTYSDKFYCIFRGLCVPKDGVECESFTLISIDSLLV